MAGHRPAAKTTPSEGETCTEGKGSHRRDEGVVLRERASGRPPTKAATTAGVRARELPPECGRRETERDCGTGAYSGTYCDVRRAENERAY